MAATYFAAMEPIWRHVPGGLWTLPGNGGPLSGIQANIHVDRGGVLVPTVPKFSTVVRRLGIASVW